MKRLVYTFNLFYLFGLTLWIGGMFLLGILVEVMVRIHLKEQPLVASKVMNRIMDDSTSRSFIPVSDSWWRQRLSSFW